MLIVDDEQALAKALARQLADRWDVDTVSTARDALAELSVHRYDVVACDLRMPDQSGPAIYDAIRARSPRQASRFIFTTGGSYGVGEDPIHERAIATGRPILEKPFDGATFEALVAEVAAQKDDATLSFAPGAASAVHGRQHQLLAARPGREDHPERHEPLAELARREVRDDDDATTDELLGRERERKPGR